MACFSLPWIEDLLIWIVIIAALVGLVRLVLPPVLAGLGAAGGTVAAALNIVLWAAVAIFLILIVFDLASCLMGGFHLPRHG